MYFADELRYSLRSLEKYAPWVRHVYLVTNGQVRLLKIVFFEKATKNFVIFLKVLHLLKALTKYEGPNIWRDARFLNPFFAAGSWLKIKKRASLQTLGRSYCMRALVNVKTMRKIAQIFVTLSEKMNKKVYSTQILIYAHPSLQYWLTITARTLCTYSSLSLYHNY